jgi:hypothetical protein
MLNQIILLYYGSIFWHEFVHGFKTSNRSVYNIGFQVLEIWLKLWLNRHFLLLALVIWFHSQVYMPCLGTHISLNDTSNRLLGEAMLVRENQDIFWNPNISSLPVCRRLHILRFHFGHQLDQQYMSQVIWKCIIGIFFWIGIQWYIFLWTLPRFHWSKGWWNVKVYVNKQRDCLGWKQINKKIRNKCFKPKQKMDCCIAITYVLKRTSKEGWRMGFVQAQVNIYLW